MPCFHPVKGYRKRGGGFTLSARDSLGAVPMTVPCGQCIGCRMDKARDWQTRLCHEASRHEESSFLTLTYSAEHLPDNYSVDVRHLQLFMKRVRKRAVAPLRFFGCGEYGDRDLRPHYHVLLFGEAFIEDRKPWRRTATGHTTYRSEALDRAWGLGFAEFGTVTAESAGYVARYCMKKVNGPMAVDHYTRAHPDTGEIHRVHREFITMSRRPGIGGSWYDEYSGDAFPSDFVILDGQRRPVPGYYTRRLPPDEAESIKLKRKERAKLRADNNTPERLATREEVLALRLENLKRDL